MASPKYVLQFFSLISDGLGSVISYETFSKQRLKLIVVNHPELS